MRQQTAIVLAVVMLIVLLMNYAHLGKNLNDEDMKRMEVARSFLGPPEQVTVKQLSSDCNPHTIFKILISSRNFGYGPQKILRIPSVVEVTCYFNEPC